MSRTLIERSRKIKNPNSAREQFGVQKDPKVQAIINLHFRGLSDTFQKSESSYTKTPAPEQDEKTKQPSHEPPPPPPPPPPQTGIFAANGLVPAAAATSVLCLDGGVMGNIISIQMIRELEKRTGMRAVDLFDKIVGTGMGGDCCCPLQR